ncbi:hypothetical protein [Pantoea agglomerans]|uniref:hypothetical protein n=1 Tax=Enterobacter agglomerans TaxID=549 RepID=UPI003017FB16
MNENQNHQPIQPILISNSHRGLPSTLHFGQCKIRETDGMLTFEGEADEAAKRAFSAFIDHHLQYGRIQQQANEIRRLNRELANLKKASGLVPNKPGILRRLVSRLVPGHLSAGGLQLVPTPGTQFVSATIVPMTPINYLICHVQYDEIIFARIGISATGEYVFRDVEMLSARTSVDNVINRFKQWARSKSGAMVYCQEGVGQRISEKLTKENCGRPVFGIRLGAKAEPQSDYANVKAVAYSHIENLSARNGIHYLTPAQREGVESYFAGEVHGVTADDRIRYEKGRCSALTMLALVAAAHMQRCMAK